MNKIALLAGVLATCVLNVADAEPPRPRLVVVLAVDQFSADLFNEYRPLFVDGLKRLEGGVVFSRGHQSHAATETCPGHSTILTGDRPARTGIIANDWEVPGLPRKDKDGNVIYSVYCAERPGAVGSDVSKRDVSPQFLRVPTLGDRLKVVASQSRVVSISGKDRAAVMLGGHHADLTLWWSGTEFTTYVDHAVALPAQLAAISANARLHIAKPAKPVLPAACRGHSVGLDAGKVRIGELQPLKPGDEPAWRATPDFDAMTLDAALETFKSMHLGAGPDTDVLAISFSATDYVGHAYGTAGAEMCNQLIALDKTLGRLFAELDQSKVDYLVVLTADHGGHDVPERNHLRAYPVAERVDAALSAQAVGAKIAKDLGLANNALLGRAAFGDIYISASIPPNQRAAVLDAAVRFYRSQRQVAAVFTKSELIAAPPPAGPVDEWTLLERAKASFDPERSGDLVVLLNEFVTPIPQARSGYVATHGSPWGYDRRVPILFWWPGIHGFEQPNAVETVDILPTLASFIGLAIPPNDIDGRCLNLMVDGTSNCP